MATVAGVRTVRTSKDRVSLGRQVVRLLTTTDHKVIGKLYIATSFGGSWPPG
jgi:cytochrome c oxidase subunit I